MSEKRDLAMDPPPRAEDTVEAWVGEDARRARRAALPFAIGFPLCGVFSWLAFGRTIGLLSAISFGVVLVALVWNSRQIELLRATVREREAVRAKVVSVDKNRTFHNVRLAWPDPDGFGAARIVLPSPAPAVGDMMTVLPSKRRGVAFVVVGDKLQHASRSRT